MMNIIYYIYIIHGPILPQFLSKKEESLENALARKSPWPLVQTIAQVCVYIAQRRNMSRIHTIHARRAYLRYTFPAVQLSRKKKG